MSPILESLFFSSLVLLGPASDWEYLSQADLLLRLKPGTQIYLNAESVGTSTAHYFLLDSLTPGEYEFRLELPDNSEKRFRLALESGIQVLHVGTRFFQTLTKLPAASLGPQADLAAICPGEACNSFLLALDEDRLVMPPDDSAYYYFHTLPPDLPEKVNVILRRKLVVSMGEHADHILAGYLDYPDSEWDAEMFDEAAEIFTQLQNFLRQGNDVRESNAQFFKGLALVKRRRPGDALPRFTESFALDREAAHALEGRARALALLGRYTEAETDLRNAIDLYPEWISPKVRLAQLLVRLRQFDSARITLDSAFAIDAGSSAAHRVQGELYTAIGKTGDARRTLSLATQLDPGNAYAHAALGSLYSRRHLHEEALEKLELAIRLAPGQPLFTERLASLTACPMFRR